MFDVVPPVDGDGRSDGAEPTALDTAVVRPASGAAVLAVAGEVDTLTAPILESAVHDLIATGEPVLVIDLTEVTFLASSGLAVLIRGAHRCGADGRRLRLVAQGRPVLRPLQITGTDELFDLHTGRDTALRPALD